MAGRRRTRSLWLDFQEIVDHTFVFFPVTSANREILPCIHLLCMSCVETISSRTGKKPEDKMDCSVCTLEFEIPSIKILGERKALDELLSEFSKAANDINPLCEMCPQKYPRTWNELKSRFASVYCTICTKYACYMCDVKHENYHKTVEKRSHWTEKSPTLGFCVNNKRHNKGLEVFCIACRKAECFLCFVDTVPYEIKKEFDRIIDNGMHSLNELSKQFSVIKCQVENQTRPFHSSVRESEKQIEVSCEEQVGAVESHKNSLLGQLQSINSKVQKELEKTMGKQVWQFDPTTRELEKQIEASCEEQIKAVESHKNSLLDKLKTFKLQVQEELEKKRKAVEILLETVENFKKSCISVKSTGKPEEKFCSLGAVLKKVDEFKRELDLLMEPLRPVTSHDSPDLQKSSKTEFQWEDQRQSDNAETDAHGKTKKDETMNKMARNVSESGHQISSSTQCPSKRSENASATFDRLTKEGQNYKDREISDVTFPKAIANYKETLENLRNQIIPNKIRTRDKKLMSLLKKDEADAFRQQFDHIKRIRPDKWETTQWNSIEQCHEKLVKLACAEAEGDRLAAIVYPANNIIDDLLKQMAVMEENAPQGLRNFGNTCYFNVVIQCLCQILPLLKELCSRNISEQPLTEAFVEFWNHRCIYSPEQNAAYSNFFTKLFTSSPKFNNFRQHDSHDLLIHFLNDLRSEERMHTAQGSRLSIDPRTILTAVDKFFGGHFITQYTCLRCHKPYFVCESLLDISLPICIPQLKHYREERSEGRTGAGRDDQVWRQQDCTSTLERCKDLSHTHCSDQFTRTFLEALNEEQTIPTEEGKGYRTRQVTLTECLRFYTATERIPDGYLCLFCQDGNQAAATVTAQTMPPAIKRTLIYNPPAILVLHMKRFEQTATGFTKRSDRVSYEELLDLGPYCSSDCLRVDPEDKNVWYSLFGVVVHIGSLASGHYIAFLKIGESNSDATKIFLQKYFLDRDKVTDELKNKLANSCKRANRKVEWQPKPATAGRWIYMSDSYTREATSSEALNQEAFMLFYERIAQRGQ